MDRDSSQAKPWRCPDPSCHYVGVPSIHILNLPKGHVWSAAQVAHSLNAANRYPQSWKEEPSQ